MALIWNGDWENGNWQSQYSSVAYGGTFDGTPPLNERLFVVNAIDGVTPLQGNWFAKIVVAPGDRYGDSTGERVIWRQGPTTPAAPEMYAGMPVRRLGYESWVVIGIWLTASSQSIYSFWEWHGSDFNVFKPIDVQPSDITHPTAQTAIVAWVRGGVAGQGHVAANNTRFILVENINTKLNRWHVFVFRCKFHASAGAFACWHGIKGTDSSVTKIVGTGLGGVDAGAPTGGRIYTGTGGVAGDVYHSNGPADPENRPFNFSNDDFTFMEGGLYRSVRSGTSVLYQDGAREYSTQQEALDYANSLLTGAVGGGDTTPPTVQTVTVNSNLLTATMSEQMDATSIAAAATSVVKKNGTSVGTPGLPSINANIVTLGLPTSFIDADVCLWTYTKPGSNPLQDTAGNDLASFTDKLVQNLSPGDPGAGESTIGKSTIGVNWRGSAANHRAVYGPRTAPVTMDITELRVRLRGMSGTATTQPMKALVWNYSGSAPTTLAGTGTEVTPTGQTAEQWYVLPFASPVRINSGNQLCLGFHYGGSSSNIVQVAYDNLSGRQWLRPDTFAGGADTNWTDNDGATGFTVSGGTDDASIIAIYTEVTSPGSPPALLTAVVSASLIILTYDRALDGTSVPAVGAYAFDGTTSAGATTFTIQSVTILGSTVRLTLEGKVLHGDSALLLDYTAGATPVQDLTGGDAANLTNQAVTNLSSLEGQAGRLTIPGGRPTGSRPVLTKLTGTPGGIV